MTKRDHEKLEANARQYIERVATLGSDSKPRKAEVDKNARSSEGSPISKLGYPRK